MTRIATTMLLLGGLTGLAVAGTAGASAGQIDAPSVAVQYSSGALATDSGTRALYRRLAKAAEQVCPLQTTNMHFVSEVILKCRQEALTAAVGKIHNQRLAALHASRSMKAG